ncbi:MAG: DHHA1 domain-containing protein [Clostridiales bacterium]|nr:MAG: DHHA1 domain-containing protein [Clostridiales bacterium]
MNTVAKKWRIIENAHFYKNNIVFAACEKSAEDMQTIVAQAADELLNVKGVTCSFVICQLGADVTISARSFGEINVQVILEKLSGGGHMTMAGAYIKMRRLQMLNHSLKILSTNILKISNLQKRR